jgi:hypothetical protein
MLVLINGGPRLDRFGSADYLGRLISPRCHNVPRPGERWAADNDAFGAWDELRFITMLDRCQDWPGCLWVAAPDVVGNARATIERFWDWHIEIAGRGLPIALVGQDGAENLDLEWHAFDAFFIGGSTEWKLSHAAADLAEEGKRRGKWVHIGRVNSRRRLRIAYDLGADSVDGTGWSRFPDDYLLRQGLPYLVNLHAQDRLF